MTMRFFVGLTLLIVSILISATHAHAYIDPGSGSYVFQVIIMGIIGVGFTMKHYWLRIKEFFSRIFNRNKTE